MRKSRCIIVISCILAVLLTTINADRTNKKIYININGASMCFRRLNGTHQIGCNSNRGGNVGVVHYIQNVEDITWVIKKGTHDPYIALVTPPMFTKQYVNEMLESGKFNGMLVAYGNGTDRPSQFSPDESCPNDRQSLYHNEDDYKDCKITRWNPEGTGFLFKDFNVPIVALTNDTEVDIIIKQCFEKFNKPDEDGHPRDFPLCSAQLKDEMDAAKDTPTCMRRSQMVQGLTTENYCDPLGSHNVYGLTRPITLLNTTPDDSVIIAATRMDGSSLFDGIYPNADSAVSGIVTLLAAAKAIGEVKDTLPLNHKPIMFTFFEGESYDYIGSGRVVYDMEHQTFPTHQRELGADMKDAPAPISLNKIHAMLEVSQVGKPEESGKMWIHTDPISPENIKTKVNTLVEDVKTSGQDSGVEMSLVSTADQPLPPASLQSFLKKIKLPGLVIADHDGQFNNKYYNSRFDLPDTIDADYPANLPANESYNYITEAADHIQRVATTVARTLYKMSTGVYSTNITVDNQTVANLLNCYLHDASCELFQTVNVPGLTLGSTPFSYYVGVWGEYSSTISNKTEFTRRVLAYYMGDHLMNVTEKQCHSKEQDDYTRMYTWMAGERSSTGRRSGVCYQSTANITLAKSPAFDIEDYDWTSNTYSSWTESQWQLDAMEVRIFLVPSKEREIVTLCVGVALFIVSMVTTYFFHKRAPVMFRPLRTSL